ncbi:MAG: hypothetical protein WD355_10780 [Balneolaceae bacterium]
MSETIATLRIYIEKRFELFRLKLGEQVSLIIAESIQRFIGILMIFGGFFIAWIAFGYYLSDLLDSLSLGFLAASIPLILAGIVFLNFKPKRITRRIQAGILNDLLNSMDQQSGKEQPEPMKPEKMKTD